MKKLLTIILVILLNIAIISNSFAYDLTESDKTKIDTIISKVETLISKKGENYIGILIDRLKKIDSSKSEKLKSYVDYIVLNLDKKFLIQNNSFIILENIGEIKDSYTGMITNLYRSNELGIQFNSNIKNLLLKKDKAGRIESFIPKLDNRYYNDYESGTTTGIRSDEMIDGKIYERQSGFIEIFNKKSDTELNKSIDDIIKFQGKNPKDCKIGMSGGEESQSGSILAGINLLKAYKPTEIEVINFLKKDNPNLNKETFNKYYKDSKGSYNLEYLWAEIDLKNYNIENKCSIYSVKFSYHSQSYFIYNPGVTDKKFIYIFSNGGDRPFFEYGSLKIIK